MATKRIKEFLATATLKDKVRKILGNNDPNLKEKDRIKPAEIQAIRNNIVENGQVDEFNRLLDAISVVYKQKHRLYFESIRCELFTMMLNNKLKELADMVVSLAKDNWLIDELKNGGDSITSKRLKRNLEKIAYSKLSYKGGSFKFVKNQEGFIRISRKHFLESIEVERRRVRKEKGWAKELHLVFEEFVKQQGIEDIIPHEIKLADSILYADDIPQDGITRNILEYYRKVFDTIPEKFSDDPDDKKVLLSDILEVELFPKYEDIKVEEGELLGDNNLFTNALRLKK